MAEIEVALIEALRPMVKRMVREEVERAGYQWRWQSIRQAAVTLDTTEDAFRKRSCLGNIPLRKLDGRLYVDMQALDRQMARLP